MLKTIKNAYRDAWYFSTLESDPPIMKWLNRALVFLLPAGMTAQIFIWSLVALGLFPAILVSLLVVSVVIIITVSAVSDLPSPPTRKDSDDCW